MVVSLACNRHASDQHLFGKTPETPLSDAGAAAKKEKKECQVVGMAKNELQTVRNLFPETTMANGTNSRASSTSPKDLPDDIFGEDSTIKTPL